MRHRRGIRIVASGISRKPRRTGPSAPGIISEVHDNHRANQDSTTVCCCQYDASGLKLPSLLGCRGRP